MVRIAIVAVLTLCAAACGSGSDGDEATPTTGLEATPRVTAGQSPERGFRICVDQVGTDTALDDDVGRVEDALRDLRDELEDRSYSEVVLVRIDEVSVTAGCPEPAARDERYRFPHSKTGAMSVIGPRAELPVEHNLRVYFVADETFEEWFGDQDEVSGAEEMQCSGHQCAPSTAGLYLRAGADDDLLYEGLRRSLGFQDPAQ